MPDHMKDAVPIWTGTSAVALMIAYYSIPFLILDGAGASLGKLRPPLPLGSLAIALFGFFSVMAHPAFERSAVRAERCRTFGFLCGCAWPDAVLTTDRKLLANFLVG